MRFGVVGTNFVVDHFMLGAKQVNECEVTAVCSATQEHAECFAKKYGIKNYFTSYKEMAKSGLIDAVYIATPNSTHYDISKYFLKSNIPVFCEKPMASNIAQVRGMIECAKKNNTYLHEGIMPLFSPNFEIIRKNLSRVGKIRQVTINMSQYSTRYDAYLKGENPPTFRRELSNGALMDLGIYVFALCVALFGKPKKVLSNANLLENGVDVSGASILAYDGFCASLSYSKASDTENKIEICGEGGMLIVGHATKFFTIEFIDRKTKVRENLYKECMDVFAYEIADMIEQIKNGKIESSKIPFSANILIHEVITEARLQSKIIYPCD